MNNLKTASKVRIIRDAAQMREWSLKQRAEGRTVGLVPTMGGLHEGHASLMRQAVHDNDVCVASVFVNPAQFAPHEDYNEYPRTMEADRAMAEKIGVDVIYAPDASKMYPAGYATYVEVERLQDGLCGVTRPHFFRGVATVVTKLFNVVLPHKAYFGQKDAQQCAIIKRMVRDLDFGVTIVEMPLIRDADGLALSSRNQYLSTEDRKRALCLSQSLFAARNLLERGERDARRIVEVVRDGMKTVDIDYVELVDAYDLTPVARVDGPVLLAVAAWVGGTRLIDNIKYEGVDNVN